MSFWSSRREAAHLSATLAPVPRPHAGPPVDLGVVAPLGTTAEATDQAVVEAPSGAGVGVGAGTGSAVRAGGPATFANDDFGRASRGTGGAHRTYTVLVADDAVATRQGLVELLEDTADLVCVASVGDASAAVSAAARYRPDIALLDVLMPGGGGLSAALGIREVSPQTRMLAYSASSDRASVVQMLRSGAHGYLLKGSPARDLIDGLRRCASGSTALSDGLSEHLIAEMGELGRAERAFSAAARARYQGFSKLLEPGGSTPTYQPIVQLRTGELVGYEALTDFGGGVDLTTEDIFREAHEIGLGVQLELHTAGLAVAGFRPELARSRSSYIAVNASPGLLYRPALLEVLSELPPERVVVEITEQHEFESYTQLRETVHLVHERGMRVAVDDTGSGFASLQRLVDVRPEIVKLDRGLTAQIDTDAPRRALVAAIRQFADDMGITVVAEGIEREEQLVVLREIGIDCGQGYLLGRPAPLPAGR